MIVTYLKDRMVYSINWGNGRVEEATEFPHAFQRTRSYPDISMHHCYSLCYKIRKKIGIQFDSISDFHKLGETNALAGHSMTYMEWRELATCLIRRLHKALYGGQAAIEFSPKEPAFANMILSISQCFYNYWKISGRHSNSFYDVEGVKQELASLTSLKDRIAFLSLIIDDMAEPWGFEVADRNADGSNDEDGLSRPRWGLLYVYAHAIPWEDVERLTAVLVELKTSHSESLNEEIMALAHGEIRKEIGLDQKRIPDKILAPQLVWDGAQTDLVYIMDCLRESGLLSATDGMVVQHFDYGGTAKDKAKTYRDIRKKIRDGESHPDRSKIERLIAALQRELR